METWLPVFKSVATASPFAGLLMWLYIKERAERRQHQADAMAQREKRIVQAEEYAKGLAGLGEAVRIELRALRR